VLDDYVARFNADARAGDWEPLLELLAPDAELWSSRESQSALSWAAR